MDLTHLHLVVNHLPIIGIILGALVLVYGIFTKSKETKIASYGIIIISTIGGIIAFSTGEAAEETIEKIGGISESIIKTHEEAAELTMLFIYALGLIGLISFALEIQGKKLAKAFSVVTLVLSLLAFGFVAWTGNTGGKIRHPEITNGYSDNPVLFDEEHHDEDDDK